MVKKLIMKEILMYMFIVKRGSNQKQVFHNRSIVPNECFIVDTLLPTKIL